MSVSCLSSLVLSCLKYCTRVFSMRVIYQGGPKQDLDQEHSLLKVSGGWWVVVGGCFLDYSFSSGPFETRIETSLRE